LTAVLCYDGSDGARHALAAAARVLGGRDAIVLTLVVSLAPEVFQGRAEALPEHAEARRVAEEGVQLARAAGFAAHAVVEVTAAHAGDRIVAFAETRGADVIVVGARGLSAVKAALLGSVSQAVVQHARTPVLVVPAPREP